MTISEMSVVLDFMEGDCVGAALSHTAIAVLGTIAAENPICLLLDGVRSMAIGSTGKTLKQLSSDDQ